MDPDSSVRRPWRRGVSSVVRDHQGCAAARARPARIAAADGGPTRSLPSALSERPPTPYQPRFGVAAGLTELPPSPLAQHDQITSLNAARPARPARPAR